MSGPISKPVSFDGHPINDGTDYVARQISSTGLPSLSPAIVQRDGAAGIIGRVEVENRQLSVLQITIENDDDFDTLLLQLHQWFAKRESVDYITADLDGGNPRKASVVCTRFQAASGSGNKIFLATLQMDGLADKDHRFRRTTISSDTWNVTGSPSTKTVTNNGHDKAFPILRIEPTSVTSGGYSHKMWVGLRWRVTSSYTNYPVDIANASFDSQVGSTNVEQADGDDIRVFVNGGETARWLNGANTASTKIWCNLSFQPKVELTTAAAIASSGSIDTIDFVESITSLPNSGIMVIDSEVFVYTSKNNSLKRVLGVTRASRGSSMAAHSAGATAWWAQHDIWILYGNASVSSPSYDDNYKPIFNLSTSTNTSWDYDEFGDNGGLRTGRWSFAAPATFGATKYTADHNTNASPWSEMGVASDTADASSGRWSTYNPCGITNANFQNGESYHGGVGGTLLIGWGSYIQSSTNGTTWVSEYEIPVNTVVDTWESWSQSQALDAGATHVGMHHDFLYGNDGVYLEVADVTLTLNSSNTPTVALVAEQGNYSLDCTIENETTGDQIALELIQQVDAELVVDTDNKTVIYSLDESSQFQALTLVGGARLEWLPLAVGDNDLKFTQLDTGNVTVTVEWEERLFF